MVDTTSRQRSSQKNLLSSSSLKMLWKQHCQSFCVIKVPFYVLCSRKTFGIQQGVLMSAFLKRFYSVSVNVLLWVKKERHQPVDPYDS
jgi:hypothetical protein